jgi:N6-adenosine-specific RNA methylase IME4
MSKTDNASEAYGKLTEGLHLAGYTFERASTQLEWLLEGDRWKLDGRFDDVNAFMDSLRLGKFKQVAEQRKRIVDRIKILQPKVSNRQIARTLGVDEATLRKAEKTTAEKSAVGSKKSSENNGPNSGAAEKSAPAEFTGEQVAKLAEKQAKRFERQQEREATPRQYRNGGKVEDLTALAASGFRAGVVYADPPWCFEVYSGKGKDRSAERHYDTQSLDEIAALPVASVCAEDCALLLWAVMPELPGALQIIEAWGFTYKTTGFVWIKENRSGEGLFTGMGYWTRANAEVCLLATRGSPKRLAADVHQVLTSPVGAHSRKPGEVRERIQRLLGGPYLELYGRQAVPGWTVWGNEVAAEAAE